MNKKQIREILERAADDRRIDDDIEAEEIRSAFVKMREMSSGIRSATAQLSRIVYDIDYEMDVLSGNTSAIIPDSAETSELTDDVNEVFAAYQTMFDAIREFLEVLPC